MRLCSGVLKKLNMNRSLEGKVAIISGASRGIGFAIAKSFEAQGADLVLTCTKDLKALDVFAHAKKIRLDLSKKEDIDSLVSEALESFGRIDILVNNAGFFKQTEFTEISEEELDAVIDIDLKGPFLLLQRVFAQMKKQKKGKIVNIASGAGKMGSSKASHYAACKAAMISLTKSLAKSGAPYNINVNAVAPGYIETDMIADLLTEKRPFIESVVPLARVGKPEDVASAVKFLVSDSADYITGQTIPVDGGQCML